MRILRCIKKKNIELPLEICKFALWFSDPMGKY